MSRPPQRVPAAVLSPLRVLPVPRSVPPLVTEPPEDGHGAEADFVQGTLAVEFAAMDRSAVAGARDDLAPVLPDPEAAAGSLAQALVEIMAGSRPAPQALRWTSTEVYTVLARRAAVAARRPRGIRPRPHRTTVRRVLCCQPQAGVVEASAVVVDGPRIRAMALRLEARDGRWRVTALQVG